MKRLWVAAVLALVGAAAVAEAQFGRAFRGTRVATEADFDGRFHYCRLVYQGAFNGNGGSWRTDYPNADINMSIRLSELTKIGVSKASDGSPKPLLVRVGGDEQTDHRPCPRIRAVGLLDGKPHVERGDEPALDDHPSTRQSRRRIEERPGRRAEHHHSMVAVRLPDPRDPLPRPRERCRAGDRNQPEIPLGEPLLEKRERVAVG